MTKNVQSENWLNYLVSLAKKPIEKFYFVTVDKH